MSSHLEDLREWLKCQLCESEKIIQLIKNIQSRKDKIATPSEQTDILNFQATDCRKVFSNHVISLVLESKSRKQLEKKHIYQPFLLINDNESDVQPFLSLLRTYFDHLTPFHFDIIVKNNDHCIAVQLRFNGKDFRVFYLDASDSPINQSFLDKLRAENPAGIFNVEKMDIQHDEINCAIFSIQHLNNLFYYSRGINRSEPLSTVDSLFETLPAVFFKHSQRARFVKDYPDKDHFIDKRGKHTLREHREQYSIFIDNGNRVKKPYNYSVLFKRHKYLQVAIDELNLLKTTLSSDEIQCRLNDRMDFKNKNSVGFDTEPLDLIKENRDLRSLSCDPHEFISHKQSAHEESVTIAKHANNKNIENAGLGLIGLGVTAALTGLILKAFSENNLSERITALAVVMMISGCALNHLKNLTRLCKGAQHHNENPGQQHENFFSCRM